MFCFCFGGKKNCGSPSCVKFLSFLLNMFAIYATLEHFIMFFFFFNYVVALRPNLAVTFMRSCSGSLLLIMF